MAGVLGLIWVSHEANCFFLRDWTGQISLKRLRNSLLARNDPTLESSPVSRRAAPGGTGAPSAQRRGIDAGRLCVPARRKDGFFYKCLTSLTQCDKSLPSLTGKTRLCPA